MGFVSLNNAVLPPQFSYPIQIGQLLSLEHAFSRFAFAPQKLAMVVFCRQHRPQHVSGGRLSIRVDRLGG